MTSASLRLRLITIILTPLLVIAAVVGTWRVIEAKDSAQDIFDRNLLLTALAVARDVALLDGDAIQYETEKLLSESAGGPIRYHVYAPDGVFVIGYAVPPVPLSRSTTGVEPFTYLDVVHRGRPVRVLRMLDVTEIGPISGTFTITVWQDMAVRDEYVLGIALRAFFLIAALVGTVAVVVWFGVNLGLKPLLDLEEAISRRNPEDLSPIRRPVPKETLGIVRRLNTLLGQVRSAIEAQNAFISDASHQLRNPIAGIRALGESILSARSLETAQDRARELVSAAGGVSDLANRLLTLERLRAVKDVPADTVDLGSVMAAVAGESRDRARDQSVLIAAEDRRHSVPRPTIRGDRVMLKEMLTNLVDNALVHGGPDLTRIAITLDETDDALVLTVADDGCGIAPDAVKNALARFGQAQPGKGSGLGLPIAEAVALRHGGRLEIPADGPGLTVRIILPFG